MRKLTYEELIAPYPIYIPNIGYLKHPTLENVFKLGMNEFSQSNYDGILNILCLTVPDYFKIIKKEDVYNSLSSAEKQELCIFDLLILSEDMILSIINSLFFFIYGDISFNKDIKCFFVKDLDTNDIIGIINKYNFDDVCNLVKQLNRIDDSNSCMYSGKPKNKIAAEMAAKFKAHKEKSKQKESHNLNLADVISALCVQHNSYNMTNIWSLTVYQLYDQFFRQNIKTQIDISANRWAAWGSEPFDFELWFKSIKNK